MILKMIDAEMWIWSWLNLYVWLHLLSSQKRVKNYC